MTETHRTAASADEPRRAALVTGGARRLGRALAVALAGAGHDVWIHYRSSQTEAEQTAAAAREHGVNAWTVQADLSDEPQTLAMFEAVLAQGRRLDVLVNNASLLEFQPLATLAYADWLKGLEPLHAAFLCCREALRIMASQDYGRIINITDSSSERIYAADRDTPYRIGKSGILMLTKAFAKSVQGENLTVNSLAPGVIQDSQTRPPADDVPAGRYASYDDLTHAMRFLLDSRSSYVSGAHLKVTGGWDL